MNILVITKNEKAGQYACGHDLVTYVNQNNYEVWLRGFYFHVVIWKDGMTMRQLSEKMIEAVMPVVAHHSVQKLDVKDDTI